MLMIGRMALILKRMKHMPVLDKMLAWEKKLYDEVKHALYTASFQDEVRTLFIAGLPEDVKAREIYNLFREFPGYESCHLRSPTPTQTQPFGFAVFVDQPSAIAALHALNAATIEAYLCLSSIMSSQNAQTVLPPSIQSARKTTLMDILAGRKTGGYIEGEISISGFPNKQSTFARVSGYVEQMDAHRLQFIVMELLLFSDFLRLSDVN